MTAEQLPSLQQIANRAEIPSIDTPMRIRFVPAITLSRWIAAGTITLDDPPTGSGHPARIHPAEAAAIQDLVHHYRDLRYHLETLGDYYAQRLAHHLDNSE